MYQVKCRIDTKFVVSIMSWGISFNEYYTMHGSGRICLHSFIKKKPYFQIYYSKKFINTNYQPLYHSTFNLHDIKLQTGFSNESGFFISLVHLHPF